MAILKQVVDLQEAVKRLMEQNVKLRRELTAMRDELSQYGCLCYIGKHNGGKSDTLENVCQANDYICCDCGASCPCRECQFTHGMKGYEWDGGKDK